MRSYTGSQWWGMRKFGVERVVGLEARAGRAAGREASLVRSCWRHSCSFLEWSCLLITGSHS